MTVKRVFKKPGRKLYLSLAENLFNAEGLESRESKIQVLVKKGNLPEWNKNFRTLQFCYRQVSLHYNANVSLLSC